MLMPQEDVKVSLPEETFPPSIFTYDIQGYRFRELLCEIFGVDSLENLGVGDDIDVLSCKTDQSTEFHRKFYDHFSEIRPEYLKLIVKWKLLKMAVLSVVARSSLVKTLPLLNP